MCVSNTHPFISEDTNRPVDNGANSIRNEKKKRVAEVVEIPLMHEFTGIHGGGNEGESCEGTATDQSRPDPMLNRILLV